MWFDYLFDGERRVEIGDLHPAIVSLSIACESLFRALLVRYLQEPDDAVVKLMNQINISRIIERCKDLRRERRWVAKIDLGKIKHLFDLRRDAIAHRGQARGLDPSECRDLAKAVRVFVLLAERALR